MMTLLILSLLGFVVFTSFYRLFLHPLARYPGPLLGRLTDWYNFYHSLKGDRHVDFVQLHKQYGEIVRYGPNRLSINNVAAISAIYGVRANTKKSYFYEVMQFYMKIPSTHATTNKLEHTRKRRILSQALSDRMLHVYEAGFLEILDNFTNRYDSPADVDGWSAPYDVAHELSLLNYDSMGKFCFGKSFGSLDEPEKAKILPTIFEGMRALNGVGHMPGIAYLRLHVLDQKFCAAMDQYEKLAAKLANECMNKCMQMTTKTKDPSSVFEILFHKAQLSNFEEIALPELESESSLLITTGSDTTATALSGVLFNLLNNAHTLAKLTEEVRSTFKVVSKIHSGQALNDCQYLSACIDEGLRLMPVIGGCLQRQVLRDGISIDGHHIPEGTDVGVPHHAIMRNEMYFSDPWAFEPRRWLASENSAESIRRARAAYCPFGIGPTGCAGKNWALIEMKLTLARLVFRYDMQIVLPDDLKGLSAQEIFQQRDRTSIDRFVVASPGPYVKFKVSN